MGGGNDPTHSKSCPRGRQWPTWLPPELLAWDFGSVNVTSFGVPEDRKPPEGPRGTGCSLPAPCRPPWNILRASHSTVSQPHSVQVRDGGLPVRGARGPPSHTSVSGWRLLQSSLPQAPWLPEHADSWKRRVGGLVWLPGATQPGFLLPPFRKSSVCF